MNLKTLIAFLFVFSVSFVVFSPTIGYEFVNWDDDIYVYDNPRIKSLSAEDIGWWFENTYYYAYIPVTMLSHTIDYFFWGLSPNGHHLTNVVLHSLNTGLVFLLGMLIVQKRRLVTGEKGDDQSDDWIPLSGMVFASLLYSIHPLRVESVAWVSDRKDLLCMLFLLPSVILYVLSLGFRGTRKGTLYGILSFLLYLCALLSKPVVIGLPLVLLGLDWYLLPDMEWKNRWKSLLAGKGWYLAASCALAVVLLTISSGGKRAYAVEQLDGVEVLLFPLYSFAFYLWKTLVPLDLSPIYPAVEMGPLVVGSLFTCLITLGALLMARRGRKEYLLCWIAYGVFLLPTVAGLSSGMQPSADRFAYISTVCFFIGLGGVFISLAKRASSASRLIAAVASLVLLAGLGSGTLAYSSQWQSSSTLWKYVYERFPVQRDYVDAYVNLGAVYADRMELDEAEKVLREATQVDPRNADAFYNLAHVLYLRGQWEDAVEYFGKSMECDSTYARAFFNYAIVNSQLGRDSLAIPAMRHAARLGFTDATNALRTSGIPLEEPVGTSSPE